MCGSALRSYDKVGGLLNGNCHFIFGAAVGTAAAMNTELLCSYLPNITATPETATLLVLGGLIGGIFPDIDNPLSYFGKLTVPLSKWIGNVGKVFGKENEHHRGIFHDAAIYITGLILSYLYFPPLVGFFVGCLSHIYLDMFNPSGIPFLFGVKHLHLGKILSGSKGSVIFTWMSAVSVLIIGFFAPLII